MGSATQVAKSSRAWHSVWHGSQHQQSIEIIGEPHKQKLWVTCISTKIVFQVSHGAATSDINMPQIHPNTSNGIAFIVFTSWKLRKLTPPSTATRRQLERQRFHLPLEVYQVEASRALLSFTAITANATTVAFAFNKRSGSLQLLTRHHKTSKN